ncbi:hypothetical protein G5I_09158 [Acromyrmex echinatior]|uniref:Uncharacterized protein n=1 Tax=Acromyrmex echinatior TaxID=103372 RepID=F4WTG0_ACREC|nr:hypothetical protein G5I_09158 [Acromyrmex echinatior]
MRRYWEKIKWIISASNVWGNSKIRRVLFGATMENIIDRHSTRPISKLLQFRQYTEMINHNGTMRFHLSVTKATVCTPKLKIHFEKNEATRKIELIYGYDDVILCAPQLLYIRSYFVVVISFLHIIAHKKNDEKELKDGFANNIVQSVFMSYFGEVSLQQKLNTVLGFSVLESPNNVLHFDCNKTSPACHISELRSDKICCVLMYDPMRFNIVKSTQEHQSQRNKSRKVEAASATWGTNAVRAEVRVEVFRGYQSERIFAVASCPAPQGLPSSNQTSTPETPLVPNESAIQVAFKYLSMVDQQTAFERFLFSLLDANIAVIPPSVLSINRRTFSY